MADSESPSEGNPTKITPDMFIRVMRDKGTPQERELILKAMKDPHSELHDWLEGVGSWAEKAFGRKNSSRAADRMISEAVARQHREDVVAFLRRKRSEGRITEEELSRILATGAIETDSTQSLTYDDYTNAAKAMFRLTLELHPELFDEVDKLLNERGRHTIDRGSP